MVRLTTSDRIAQPSTLGDPASANALGEAMVHALQEAFDAIDRDPDVRVVVLLGRRRHVLERRAPRRCCCGSPAARCGRPTSCCPGCSSTAPVPVIAAMAGHATGGGFALGLAADIVLLGDESRYGFTFMNLGFTPGMGTTMLCEHVMSPAVAHELLYTGRAAARPPVRRIRDQSRPAAPPGRRGRARHRRAHRGEAARQRDGAQAHALAPAPAGLRDLDYPGIPHAPDHPGRRREPYRGRLCGMTSPGARSSSPAARAASGWPPAWRSAGCGANVTLTHKWGSADEAAIAALFAGAGAPAPSIVQADAANDGDVAAVLEGIRRSHERLEVLVSNAAFGAVVRGLDDYSKKALHTGIDYSAWPLVTHTLAARALFGRAPRYVIGLSSAGPETMLAGYDLIATAKSVLETLCRYLNYRLSGEGTSRQCRSHALRRHDVAVRHVRPGIRPVPPPLRARRLVDAGGSGRCRRRRLLRAHGCARWPGADRRPRRECLRQLQPALPGT